MSAIWDDEMDKMLVAFKNQAKMSLRAIKTTAQRKGLSLSPEFKEYFLSVSNTHIKAAYEDFEAASSMEDQLNSRADSVTNIVQSTGISDQSLNFILNKRRNSARRTNDPIEVVDSDDEASVNEVNVKSETNTIEIDDPTVCFSSNRALNEVNERTRTDLVNPSAVADLVNSTNHDVIDSLSSHNEGRVTNDGRRPILHDKTIQVNGASVGIMDRSVIKAEPTDTSSYENLNMETSGDQRLIIHIYDSDDEEMYKTMAGRTKNIALEHGVNEVMPSEKRENVPLDQKKTNGEEVCIEVKADIKPKREAMDDDTPLVLVEVTRVIDAPKVVYSHSNGCREPEQEIVNEKEVSNGNCSLATSNQTTNVFSIDRSSSKALRKVGRTNNGLAQKGQNNTKLKRFKCQHCDFASSHKGNFERHMRTHSGEKPYPCDRCPNRFSQLSYLNKHRKIHAEEFRFHCSRCFHGFSLKNEHKLHEGNCKALRYECYLCKKCITRDKKDLKRHMRTHTGEKPFRCEVCMKKFSRKGNLKHHLNTIHA